MLRLFVALEIPEARKLSIDKAVQPLRAGLPQARWTARESWHVTLKFLGATPEDRLPAVTATAGSAAASSEVAPSALTGLGAFPAPRRARVLWVGLDDGAGVLARLASALAGGFGREGFAREARPWRPHLTLARFKAPAPIEAALEAAGPIEIDAEPFEVAEIVLFRSRLQARGAVYEPLARFPLGS